MKFAMSIPEGMAARSVSVLFAGAILTNCALFGSWHDTGDIYPVSVTWNDTRWCVPTRLKRVLNDVSQRFGPVSVHSSHRWLFENWRKGGKPRSYHLTCRAVDFSVRGDPQGVLEYLIADRSVGGYSRYAKQGFYHIDSGPRRTW
jgi:Peptidase M15